MLVRLACAFHVVVLLFGETPLGFKGDGARERGLFLREAYERSNDLLFWRRSVLKLLFTIIVTEIPLMGTDFHALGAYFL